MGLFSWLFGSPKNYKELPAKITKKRERKLEVLAEDCGQWLTRAERVIMVCHFDETLDSLRERFENDGIQYNLIQSEINDNDLQRLLAEPSFGKVVLVQSCHLNVQPSSVAPELIPAEKEAAILVAEKSPERNKDAAVYELAKSLPFQCKIGYFASMDDYLMSFILGPWVRTMLEKMGFDDQEVMENNMMTRRLTGAQKKTVFPAPHENPNSEQAWFTTHPPRH